MGLGETWFRLCNKPLVGTSLAMVITFQRGRTSKTSAGVLNLRGPMLWKGHSIWSMTCASAEGSCPTSSASEGGCPLSFGAVHPAGQGS